MTFSPTSLVDILRWRAINQPHRLAYRYLVDGEDDEVVFTYKELDRRARSIAALLQSFTNAGDRALLLLPPGLDFIAAYFGCLYAKIIAVPVNTPPPARLERMLPMILSITANAEPAIAILTSSIFDLVKSQSELKAKFGNMKLLVADKEEEDDRVDKWDQADIGVEDIAFLQYTSGSTSTPRGVMISHGNLLHNMGLIANCIGVTDETHCVIWLPPYHDMGLIGGILQGLYSGYPVTLMPHMMFLQRPFRWLQAISRFKATTSVAPNFAYDLCTRKIRPEQKQLLDLSRWDVAFIGAEQVYHKTLNDFADYFACCGFRRNAFLPCYGLAEATLMVTGGKKARSPVIQNLMSLGLEQNQVIIAPAGGKDTRTLVSSGENMPEQKLKIVNTETLMQCPEDQIGEIWVSGPSVASGYWNKPGDTELSFGACLGNSHEGPFLRTGDLGFLHEGELYITGRIKDLIISDGSNHYANDIEKTVESSHPAIRPAGTAAFSINRSGGEHVIIVAEIDHKLHLTAEEIIVAIRKSVAMHHDLHVNDIKLTIAGAIPRTSSGKIRHNFCKTTYMAGTLREINLP